MTTSTLAPPSQRLADFKMRHLVRMLQELWTMTGTAGFDPFRDDRTKTKDALITHMVSTYTREQIDQASETARQSYPAGYGKGRSSSGRGQSQGQQSQPAQSAQQSVQSSGQSQGQQSQPAAQPPSISNAQLPGAPNNADPMAALAQALWPHLRPGVGVVATSLDQYLQQQITEALAKVKANGPGVAAGGKPAIAAPTVIALTTPTMPEPKNLGVQHRNFPLLLTACNARMRSGHRLNIWLYGPAGTGKTTAAEVAAGALGLSFTYNGALDTRYDLIGFRTANGDVVRTPFRDAWENGGVYLFDEIDASNPGALLALNGALANGNCPFPDGMVPRHKDCVIIAGANTTGAGATLEYVGRMKQDATLTDRFVYLDWPLDEALEAALCADAAWLERIRALRDRVKARNIKGMAVTPRATLFGEALIAAGLDRQTVEAMTVRKGATAETWAMVS